MNKIEPVQFLSPEDKTLNQIRTILQVTSSSGYPPSMGCLKILCRSFFHAKFTSHSAQVAGSAGILGVSAALHLEGNQILQLVIATLFALTADQVRSVQSLSPRPWVRLWGCQHEPTLWHFR